jgi:hypothetical protein
MSTTILTDTKLKALKAATKLYKVKDGSIGGLHVAVSPKGKKVFRLAYNFQGKAQLLTLGAYPEVSLEGAREAARNAKKQLAQVISPAAAKKAEKAKVRANELTFRSVAADWLAFKQPEWSQVHLDDTVQKLELHVLPRFGDKSIAEVAKADIKPVLDTLQAQKKFATLKKMRSIVSQILRYAVDQEIPGIVADWTAQLHRQYVNPVALQKHRAAITAC